jgi:hypothetical protein
MIKWSDLLRRLFLMEVLVCQFCGGKRRIVALIDEGPVARRILADLGLPTSVPARAPARTPAQVDLWNTGPPALSEPKLPECGEQPPPFDFDQSVPDADLFA